MSKTKRNAYIAMLCALAIVINLFENYFIPPLAFGIRFGLANIISMITIKLLGIREMNFVVLTRLTLGNVLKGTIFGTPFWISALGLIFSSIVIIVTDRINCSIYFTSMMSAFFHTIGQLIVVCAIYSQIRVMALLPMLIVSSLGTGFLTGVISKEVLKRIRLD